MCKACNASNASFAALDKERKCYLCGRSLETVVRCRAMLAEVTDAKIREVRQLLIAYEQGRLVNFPMRTLLLDAAIKSLQDAIALEGTEMPPLQLDWPEGDESEEDKELV